MWNNTLAAVIAIAASTLAASSAHAGNIFTANGAHISKHCAVVNSECATPDSKDLLMIRPVCVQPQSSQLPDVLLVKPVYVQPRSQKAEPESISL